jgi:choline dehydrogenase-like flavoprotein
MLDQDERGEPVPSGACIRCNRVDGFPCLVNGKADAQVVCVDPAPANPNVTLVTGTRVQRLETDSGGKNVTAVVAELDDGSSARFSGDVVVVACGALNSALLSGHAPRLDSCSSPQRFAGI